MQRTDKVKLPVVAKIDILTLRFFVFRSRIWRKRKFAFTLCAWISWQRTYRFQVMHNERYLLRYVFHLPVCSTHNTHTHTSTRTHLLTISAACADENTNNLLHAGNCTDRREKKTIDFLHSISTFPRAKRFRHEVMHRWRWMPSNKRKREKNPRIKRFANVFGALDLFPLLRFD